MIIMDRIIRNIKERVEEIDTIIWYKNKLPIKMSSLQYKDDIVVRAKSQNKRI